MAIEQYLAEIHKYPLLTAEQELELSKSAKKGDLDSRELLITSNLSLVVSIALNYSRNRKLEDLIQQGNCGLLQAADKFDPNLGYRFSTYATWWIRQEIFSFFEGKDMFKISSEQRIIRKRIYGVIIDYLGAHSEEPSYEQIATELNKSCAKKYSARDIEELLQMYDNLEVTSLNKPICEDADAEQIDFVAGEDGRDTLESIASASTVDIIYKQIRQLETDDFTKKILEEKLYNHKSLKDLTVMMRLRTEQVRQRYTKGIRLLKYTLKNNPQFMESVRLSQSD